MDSPPGSAKSSPEAELGHRLEDLWDIQEPQLSPTEKLNSCFESILVAAFPPAPSSEVVEIPSDSTLANAIEILSKHKIMSAPVRDVEAPENASWIDRYIGIVEFAGIAVWILHQSEVVASGMKASPAATRDANKLAAKLGTVVTLERTMSGLDSSAITVEANGEIKEKVHSTESGVTEATIAGNIFDVFTSSDLYKITKVSDISGSFRWAPFLALQKSDSFLTMLLLLSKYKMKSLPVVDLGEEKIDNIITQSAIIHMLAECVGLHWFENWGTKKLFELGLPIMMPRKLIKVREDEPVLNAFQLMRNKGVGGLPVVDGSGRKAIGTISIRDIHYLLTQPALCDKYRSITTKDFIIKIKAYVEEQQVVSSTMNNVVTCKRDDTVKDIILSLDMEKIQRIYVVDQDENLEGVITLRDIISRLVHEPHGYFGDFFDGVVPLPQGSRV
ncbi:unnamed protein product [Musa acuminata var. zebrina]